MNLRPKILEYISSPWLYPERFDLILHLFVLDTLTRILVLLFWLAAWYSLRPTVRRVLFLLLGSSDLTSWLCVQVGLTLRPFLTLLLFALFVPTPNPWVLYLVAKSLGLPWYDHHTWKMIMGQDEPGVRPFSYGPARVQ
jgi:hypothetical protein